MNITSRSLPPIARDRIEHEARTDLAEYRCEESGWPVTWRVRLQAGGYFVTCDPPPYAALSEPIAAELRAFVAAVKATKAVPA